MPLTAGDVLSLSVVGGGWRTSRHNYRHAGDVRRQHARPDSRLDGGDRAAEARVWRHEQSGVVLATGKVRDASCRRHEQSCVVLATGKGKGGLFHILVSRPGEDPKTYGRAGTELKCQHSTVAIHE